MLLNFKILEAIIIDKGFLYKNVDIKVSILDIASKSHNNLAFQARSDKLIKGLGAFVKTPRNYPKGDVEVVLNSLGFKYNRANGSHYIYTNSSGDVFEFVGNGNTVDPKTVKQLQTLVKTVPKLKTM